MKKSQLNAVLACILLESSGRFGVYSLPVCGFTALKSLATVRGFFMPRIYRAPQRLAAHTGLFYSPTAETYEAPMRSQVMSEPGPFTALGGIALYKLGAFGFVAVLAAIVVMAMTLPKTAREFVVAMISTTVSSICGGAFVVRWFDLGVWAHDDIGLIAIGGIIFVCGLPAWVLVRAWFKWAENRKDKDLAQLATDLTDMKKTITNSITPQ